MVLFKKRTDNRSDEELLAAYKRRPSESVLGLLFRRHSHKLYGLSLSYLKNPQDAEDAVMDCFADLPPKLLKYDIEDFESWLYLVVRNYCIKLLKEKTRQRTEEMNDIFEDTLVESAPDETLHTIEEAERRFEVLSDAIDQLNGHQQKCIILFYLENRSYQEIAELTSFTLNEVKSHIQNGRRNLKNFILRLI
ncbi:MAG: sigma-70 family RNA polymerase sigma factor [Phaeodactylibacter sp.]|nr:sigma-70 family RNA polymerase sigma factor [Phaeodactylibacter sp.]MCB9049510.1 sigma-70 family RNA polymerase sigma factor [Lewinellaceae bacterium]